MGATQDHGVLHTTTSNGKPLTKNLSKRRKRVSLVACFPAKRKRSQRKKTKKLMKRKKTRREMEQRQRKTKKTLRKMTYLQNFEKPITVHCSIYCSCAEAKKKIYK